MTMSAVDGCLLVVLVNHLGQINSPTGRYSNAATSRIQLLCYREKHPATSCYGGLPIVSLFRTPCMRSYHMYRSQMR